MRGWFSSRAAQQLGNPLTALLARPLIQSIVDSQIRDDHRPPESHHLPGEIFGPTTLPKHEGTSTEIVVDHAVAETALKTLLEVIEDECSKGRFYLGLVAVRFARRTSSLIGMNQAEVSCYIELPSVRNRNVEQIYRAIWRRFDEDGIRFTCHWGQTGPFNEDRTKAYYGGNAKRWTEARDVILSGDPTAKHVFASGMLEEAGL